jgi:hypothetical protein
LSIEPAAARRRLGVGIAACLVALTAPATAAAHGPVPSMGTNFQARIGGLTPPRSGIEAKVLGGDQTLSVTADPRMSLVVLGDVGEPYLRFGPDGVFVNDNSPTSYINRRVPALVPAAVASATTPRWRRVSAGPSYSWHEHRLHRAAVLAGGGGASRRLGPWLIPLRANGRPTMLRGELWYVAPPSNWWLWLLAVPAALAAALLATRLRAERFRCIAAVTLGALGLAGVVTAAIARNVLRPGGGVGLALAIAPWAVIGLLAIVAFVFASPAGRMLAALVAGVVATVSAVSLLGALDHGVVLAAIPTALARACVALGLAAGAGAIVLGFHGEVQR